MSPSKAFLLSLLLAAAPAFSAPAAGDVYSAKVSPELSVHLEKYRQPLQGAGFRFDEDAGTLLRPDTKKPATVGDVTGLLESLDRSAGFAAAERAAFVLSGNSVGLTPAERERLQAIGKTAALPKTVADALISDKLSVPKLKQDAWDEYVAQTHYWDGRGPAANAKAPASGWEQPPAAPAYFYDVEAKLGAELQKDVEARLSTFVAGRETLDRFRGNTGKLQLPAMLLLKQDSGNTATYASGMRAVVLNHRAVADVFVAGLPPDKRAAGAAAAKDPKKLAELLLSDPGARAAFVAANGDVFVHELTHAWQDKRGPFWSDMARGRVPNVDPLECEREAFIAQFRFLHEELVVEPKTALASPFLGVYALMATDFPGWKKWLDDTYGRLLPGAALHFEDVERMQELRATATLASGLMDGCRTLLTSALKRLEFDAGTKTIQSERKAYEDSFRKFIANEYPKLKAEAPERLALAYLLTDNLQGALMFAPAPKSKGDTGSRVEQAALERLSKRPRDPDQLGPRVSWVSALLDRYKAQLRGWPPGFGDIVVRTYDDWARALMKKGVGPPPDADALRSAGAFVHALDGMNEAWKTSWSTHGRLETLRADWKSRAQAQGVAP